MLESSNTTAASVTVSVDICLRGSLRKGSTPPYQISNFLHVQREFLFHMGLFLCVLRWFSCEGICLIFFLTMYGYELC